MKIYIGWDRKDMLAYEVCARSIIKHATIPLEIHPIHEWKLRYIKAFYRNSKVEDNQSFDMMDGKPFNTDFSFTRFLVPFLEQYKDEWVLFCDPDILFRHDIVALLDLVDKRKAVMCVQHSTPTQEGKKMYGLAQTAYERKNWSSLMLMNPSKCTGLTRYAVNNWSGNALHGFVWLDDSLIGGLPKRWNYLVGITDPTEVTDVAAVHYTLGTPDMPGCLDSEYANEWVEYAAKVDILGANVYIKD